VSRAASEPVSRAASEPVSRAASEPVARTASEPVARAARRELAQRPASGSARPFGAVTEPASRTASEGMSRAGMAPQVLGNREEILKIWDSEAELSRARFQRRLVEILGERGALVGEAGSCHAPG